MNKGRKSGAVSLLIGILLTVCFAVGLTAERNPGVFYSRYRVDYALDSFVAFCRSIWLPAGLIGIPLFLITLIVNLWRESRESRKTKP